ncbi:unnamed protein product [Diamesa serratosioi]
MSLRDLSYPKTANLLDSLERCKSLIAEYKLEQRSCVGKENGIKRKVISCRIYHLRQRLKKIEAILARYPGKTPDPIHIKCQPSTQMKLKTAPTNDDKLKKFSLPSQDTVENTLSRVDDQIKIIEEDSQWCHSNFKITHMILLLKLKDRVENILRRYPNGELILKKRVATTTKKPPKEMEPFLLKLNQLNADICRVKEDPMWEMSELKKQHIAELLQMRQELEDVINENEKHKKYLEEIGKDPKIKLSCKLKFALKNVEAKIAEIMDDQHWELDEPSRLKVDKLRKIKLNLEDIIRHHNGEEFLKTRTENEATVVKLPHNVMQHEVKDLEKIENQITDLEKQDDNKFKNIFMDKLKVTKSNIETSIILHKNGKEYLEQHAKKKELLKLENELEALEDELVKVDSSDDGPETPGVEKESPEEKSSRKDELMKNYEKIQKKIEEIEGGKEYLEKRAKSKNEPVKLPDEAVESVTKLDEIENQIAELEKEPDSDEKTARMEELLTSKEETEMTIKQFEDGEKFLDQRKAGPTRNVSKKSKTPKKYCAKLPRKVVLKCTLDCIKEQIASIEMDSTWCLSDYQSTRMAELLKYKDNVIQILKKFSMQDECQKLEKPQIVLSDETKKLVKDLDKVEAKLKEHETNENSDVVSKKDELEKSKMDIEKSIKEHDNGTEFLLQREKERNNQSRTDEKTPDTEATPKKPAIPKKIMVTLNSLENQMAKIADDDDHWDTNENKKLRMKHLEKSKENIENMIAKCQGGEKLLAKKAGDEASRIKLPKQANEHIRELDSIETKIDQANNWNESDFRKKHLEKLQKSKVEIENEIKKVDKGVEYLAQRAQLKAKQDKKSQQKKQKSQQDEEKKKAKKVAEKAKRRNPGGKNPVEDPKAVEESTIQDKDKDKSKKKNKNQKDNKETETVEKDVAEDEEPESTEFEAKFPKLVVILDTLEKVEKMIEVIELDVKWCSSEYKTTRVIELLRTKDNIEHFIRKLPDGEEALAKKAEKVEAALKRMPKKPKILLAHALEVAEKLISKFEDEIDDSTDVVRKTVLQKKLIKFKKLIDSAIEDSPEYQNKKENAEEGEKSKNKGTAENKTETPTGQPRTENPPKRLMLSSSLKKIQSLTSAIEKDPTYKHDESRLQYYQQMKQREDKIKELLNSLPAEDISSFHYKVHLKQQEAQIMKDELKQKCRCKKVQREEDEEGEEGEETKKAPRKYFDPEYMNRLAKPKRAIVCNTLNSLGYQVNDDKRNRIECGIGSQPMKPEDLEKVLRKKAEKSENENIVVDRTIKKNKKLLKQIEDKITRDIYEEIAERLKKTLPAMILNYKEPILMSDYAKCIQNTAYNMLLTTNGIPKNRETNGYYQKFAAIIGDFIIKTKMMCIHKDDTQTSNFNIVPMKLKSLKRNAELLKTAEKLAASLQKCNSPAQKEIQKHNLVC